MTASEWGYRRARLLRTSFCFHEKKWLDDCPVEFRPKYFRRYVDDCFLVFNDQSHIDSFLHYLNGRHPKIKFTKEVEKNGTLAFLDVNISKDGSRLSTSVYRKPSFTGLGLSFFSSIPKTVKFSVIKSSIFRAFTLCSNYKLFDNELSFLKTFFRNNGFPAYLVNLCIKNFLNQKYSNTLPLFNVPKLKRYFVLPYFGEQSLGMQKEMVDLLSNYYPYLDPRIVLRNTLTVGSFFHFKDRVPKACRSGVVYKYCCSSCGEAYIGSTLVRLKTRVAQHLGVSDRTGEMALTPRQSSIRDHKQTCDSPVTIADFTIIARSSIEVDLRLLESLHIHENKPALNNKFSAVPLYVVT